MTMTNIQQQRVKKKHKSQNLIWNKLAQVWQRVKICVGICMCDVRGVSLTIARKRQKRTFQFAQSNWSFSLISHRESSNSPTIQSAHNSFVFFSYWNVCKLLKCQHRRNSSTQALEFVNCVFFFISKSDRPETHNCFLHSACVSHRVPTVANSCCYWNFIYGFWKV